MFFVKEAVTGIKAVVAFGHAEPEGSAPATVTNTPASLANFREWRLWICDLRGNASLANFLKLAAPRVVDWRFGVTIRGGAIRKFNYDHGVKIAGFHARSFQPNIFHTGNSRGHLLHAVDHVLALFVGHAFVKFNNRNLQHGFWLAKMGLRRRVACEE